MRAIPALLTSCLVCMLLGASALADEVVLADGRVIEGKVVSQSKTEVVVKSCIGLQEISVRLDPAEVKEIKRSKSKSDEAREEYERLRSKVNASSADDWCKLGKWLSEHEGFEAEAARAFERALKISPDHAATRALLGQVKLPGGGWGPVGAGREAGKPAAAAEAAKAGPGAAGGAEAASEVGMLSQLLDALLVEAPDDFEAVRQTPFGVHPFEDVNYRFYLLGPARESYLGLRYARYGYPGQNRGCVDLVTREPFDYANYYDVVVDPLAGTTTLVPKAFPGGTGGSSLPPLGAVWIQDVPAYNAAAQRFGWTTIPAVGVTPRIPLAE